MMERRVTHGGVVTPGEGGRRGPLDWPSLLLSVGACVAGAAAGVIAWRTPRWTDGTVIGADEWSLHIEGWRYARAWLPAALLLVGGIAASRRGDEHGAFHDDRQGMATGAVLAVIGTFFATPWDRLEGGQETGAWFGYAPGVGLETGGGLTWFGTHLATVTAFVGLVLVVASIRWRRRTVRPVVTVGAVLLGAAAIATSYPRELRRSLVLGAQTMVALAALGIVLGVAPRRMRLAGLVGAATGSVVLAMLLATGTWWPG